MTPKEKAHQLVDKYYVEVLYGNAMDYSERMLRIFKIKAKTCALIAVDEMIAELAYVRTLDEEIDEKVDLEIDQRQDFLIEVEKEIKAL
jgi:hypothetical protein